MVVAGGFILDGAVGMETSGQKSISYVCAFKKIDLVERFQERVVQSCLCCAMNPSLSLGKPVHPCSE